jgi:hypothetical protein
MAAIREPDPLARIHRCPDLGRPTRAETAVGSANWAIEGPAGGIRDEIAVSEALKWTQRVVGGTLPPARTRRTNGGRPVR